MEFDVIALQHAKTEYAESGRCDDALAYDVATGLFAVSDGVAETSYADCWAQVLVQRFLEEPLLSAEGSDVEYWLRGAQERLRPQLPCLEDVHDVVREKLLRGSSATFLGARFFPEPEGGKASRVGQDRQVCGRCELLAIGDSCALHYSGKELLFAYPFSTVSDFRRLPDCFPSKGFRVSWWDKVQRHGIQVRDGDLVVLATDAVAAWLLADSEDLRRERIAVLLRQTADSWPVFLDVYRRADVIADDDSTALIVRVSDVTGDLAAANHLMRVITQERRRAFVTAWQENDEDKIALLYGDGSYFPDAHFSETGTVKLHRAQRAAAGRRLILQALGLAVEQNSPDNGPLQRLWWEYADVLRNACVAENIRKTLTLRGITLDVPPPSAVTPSAEGFCEPAKSASQAPDALHLEHREQMAGPENAPRSSPQVPDGPESGEGGPTGSQRDSATPTASDDVPTRAPEQTGCGTGTEDGNGPRSSAASELDLDQSDP